MKAFRHTTFKNRGPPLLLTSLSALAAGSIPWASLGLCVHSQSPGSHHNLSVGALNPFGSRKRRRSIFWLAATTVECFLQHRRRKHSCKCDFLLWTLKRQGCHLNFLLPWVTDLAYKLSFPGRSLSGSCFKLYLRFLGSGSLEFSISQFSGCQETW